MLFHMIRFVISLGTRIWARTQRDGRKGGTWRHPEGGGGRGSIPPCDALLSGGVPQARKCAPQRAKKEDGLIPLSSTSVKNRN